MTSRCWSSSELAALIVDSIAAFSKLLDLLGWQHKPPETRVEEEGLLKPGRVLVLGDACTSRAAFVPNGTQQAIANDVFVSLGVVVDLASVIEDGVARVGNKPSRVLALGQGIAVTFRRDRLPSGDAADLDGKLGFSERQCSGCLGRGAHGPIRATQADREGKLLSQNDNSLRHSTS